MAGQFPLRATALAAQEACRGNGLCGEVDDDQQTICIKYENHDGLHGWETPDWNDVVLPRPEPKVIRRYKAVLIEEGE